VEREEKEDVRADLRRGLREVGEGGREEMREERRELAQRGRG
jgi:hypothetical protein